MTARPIYQKAAGQGVSRAQSAKREDEHLIDRIKKGDTDAYTELVEKYQDRLFNTCWRISGHLEDARDLTQETFLRAFEKLATFRDQSSFYTWIYRVAVNLALSQRRTDRRRRLARDDPAGRATKGTQAEQLAERTPRSPEEDPGDEIDRAELQKAVAHALQELDDEHRSVVVLRDMEGFDYAEIAEVLQIPPGTVKSRLHRARMALRAAILPVLRPDVGQA